MKRSFKHWSVSYMKNRVGLFIWEKSHPGLPWLTRDSIKIIEGLIFKSDKMIEFGSGRSTRYFSNRVNKLTSIETDIKWYEKVSNQIVVSNQVELILLETQEEFMSEINSLENHTIDIALIDGAYRDLCANSILNKIKNGGIIIIDNANLFLFNPRTNSPNSIKNHDEMSKEWKNFYDLTKSNRRVWTTNGISDTLIIFIT